METVITDSLIQALGVGEPLEIIRLAGNANENYLIQTSTRKVVVKCLGEHTPENEELEGAYRQYLAENDLPVSRFLKFNDKSYTYTEAGRSFVALDYVEGAEAREKAILVSAQLGEFSAQLHSLDYKALPERVNWLNSHYLDHILSQVTLDEALQHELKHQNASFPDFWDGSLPVGIVHGDLHLGNTIIDPSNQIVSVIDWEEVGVVPLLLDLAGTVQALAQHDGAFDMPVFDAFFDAYQQRRSLSEPERQLFAESIRYRSFIVYIWSLMKYNQGLMSLERTNHFRDRFYGEVEVPQIPLPKR